MRDFGLASLVYIGVNIGIYLVGGLIVVLFTDGGFSNMQVFTVWLLAFFVVVGAGYAYAVKRRHDRMRRVMLQLPFILVMNVMALFVWINYI